MIIISGVSRGIGKFLWDQFVDDGFPVMGLYKTSSKELDEVKNTYCFDITSNIDVEKWIANVKNDLKSIVLINSAGINYNAVAHKADLDTWKRVIEVNLFGSFSLIHSLLPFMREEGWGRIINLSSIVAQTGAIGTTAYAASKSALWGLTKSLAKENGAKSITVNTLNLGYFNTGMIMEIPEEKRNKILESIPNKRLGNPIEIYQVIRMLMANEYINGTMIDINAGLY